MTNEEQLKLQIEADLRSAQATMNARIAALIRNGQGQWAETVALRGRVERLQDMIPNRGSA